MLYNGEFAPPTNFRPAGAPISGQSGTCGPNRGRPMQFDRPALEQAFAKIGQRAIEADKIVEIAIYGGSALLLTLPARVATKDVDAVFQEDAGWIRRIAAEIGEELGWPTD